MEGQSHYYIHIYHHVSTNVGDGSIEASTDVVDGGSTRQEGGSEGTSLDAAVENKRLSATYTIATRPQSCRIKKCSSSPMNPSLLVL